MKDGDSNQENPTPVKGIPDPQNHKICLRCRKWYQPEDGTMVYPEASGPISNLRIAAAKLADDDSKMRFICHRCIKVRKYTKVAIIGIFVFLVVLIIVRQ